MECEIITEMVTKKRYTLTRDDVIAIVKSHFGDKTEEVLFFHPPAEIEMVVWVTARCN